MIPKWLMRMLGLPTNEDQTHLTKAFYFQLLGRRSTQEDEYLIDEANGLYLVCDGVGGGVQGALASHSVVKKIAEAVKEGHLPIHEREVNAMLRTIQDQLVMELRETPEAEGMSTTLTMLFLNEGNAYLSHIGDSRIYHYKAKDKSVWRTKDHSIVQELYDSGILGSEAEMLAHPMRHQITRAFSIHRNAVHPKAEVMRVKMMSGDLFLLCSDGVSEPFDLGGLEQIITDELLTMDQRIEKIRQQCADKSSDNATAVAIFIL